MKEIFSRGIYAALVAIIAAFLVACGGGGGGSPTSAGPTIDIVAISPVNASTNVSVTQTLVITTSPAAATASATLVCGTTTVPVSVSIVGADIRVTPATPMPYSSSCQITGSATASGVTDQASAAFTTVAAPAPTVLYYTADEAVYGIADNNYFYKLSGAGAVPFVNGTGLTTPGPVPFGNCAESFPTVILASGRIAARCTFTGDNQVKDLEIDPKNGVIYLATQVLPGTTYRSVNSICDGSNRCSIATVSGGFYYIPGFTSKQVRFQATGGADMLIDERPPAPGNIWTWKLVSAPSNPAP